MVGVVMLGLAMVLLIPGLGPLEDFRDASIDWVNSVNRDSAPVSFEQIPNLRTFAQEMEEKIHSLAGEVLQNQGATTATGSAILAKLDKEKTSLLASSARALSKLPAYRNEYLTKDEQRRLASMAGLLDYLIAEKTRLEPGFAF